MFAEVKGKFLNLQTSYQHGGGCMMLCSCFHISCTGELFQSWHLPSARMNGQGLKTVAGDQLIKNEEGSEIWPE